MSIFDYLNHKLVGYRIKRGISNLLGLKKMQERRVGEITTDISILIKKRKKLQKIVVEIDAIIETLKEDLA